MADKQKLTELELAQIKADCNRFLCGHLPRTGRAWLESLAASPLAESTIDRYGEGPAIQALEQEVAELLGKEAAVFVHKGVVAQQMALRVWSERTGHQNIVLHPKSHIDYDEENAYERLHPLVGVRVGKDYRPFNLAELEAVREPSGAIVVELPLRQAGYKLPSWEELTLISTWAKEHKIPLHFDGARLWETAPFYERSYAEIAALADSVYVSFYKGLGGMGGCVLAGPTDFIAETKVWKSRLGGNLFTAFPFIISAQEGLRHHLPKMASYCRRAQEVATVLSEIPGIVVTPNPPHTNAFQVYLPQNHQALKEANLKIAQTERLWLFGGLEETNLPDLSMTEFTVGEATEQWTNAEIYEAVERLLALSRAV